MPPVEGCDLSPPPSQLFSFLGIQWACLLRCALCLFWGADLWLRPSWWMWTVQNPKKSWLAMKSACSWYRMPLWDRDCPLPALAVSGRGWACLQPASSAQSFVERGWRCLRLGLFGIAIPQSGLLSQASSLRLPSGHSGLVLTLSNTARASLSSPCLLVVDARVWAASPLGVALGHVICGF